MTGLNETDSRESTRSTGIMENRHDTRFTLAASQLPIEQLHDVINDPTQADAILDRLVHSAYKINFRGDSMRKRRSKLTTTPQPE